VRAAVFLDRDGVLLETHVRDGVTRPPESVAAARILPGVDRAIASLRQAGFALVVVTNQPDVARGTATREQVESVNRMLQERFSFDDIRVCYHDNQDGCACRKPKPGMLVESAKVLAIDLQASFMVGDRLTDVEAGRKAGCRSILVGSSHDTAGLAHHHAPDLESASRWILSQARRLVESTPN
jgi:D-glycero-D-manno-heptose 1,7-bisphosphate phosphatase